MHSGKVRRLAERSRSEAPLIKLRPSRSALAALCALAAVACVVPALAQAPNRALLVKELQLPPISLNLNLSFDPADLRIPPAADAEAEVKKLQEQLKANDRPDLHLALAEVFMQQRKDDLALLHYEAAATGYQKLAQADSKNAADHLGYAQALLALGDDEGAAEAIERGLVLDDKLWKAYELSADLHSRHAVLAYNQGFMDLMNSHLAAAEEAATEAVKLGPDDPHPYVMLFLAKWLPAAFELHRDPHSGLANLPRYEEMSELLRKAADLAPHYPRLRQFATACKMAPFFTAQMLKGLSAGIWKDLDQAQQRVLSSCRDEFLALSNEAPDYRGSALLFTGVSAFMMDDRPAAYEYLAASAQADPQSTSALEIHIAFLTQERKWPQALELAQELVRRKPSSKASTWVGRIQSEEGRLKEAEEAFRSAAGLADATALANLGLGVALLRNNANPLDALVPLRTAWERAPDQPETWTAWAAELSLVGETAEAAKRLQEALVMWPDNQPLQHVAALLAPKPQ